MTFEQTLASYGLNYFLCSLGYFSLGIILITHLKRGAHKSSELAALKTLAFYGLVRGTFYFGQLFFLISFQKTSPLANGLIHEFIWVSTDYITVLVFFVFAMKLMITINSSQKNLYIIAPGIILYWTLIYLLGARSGLDFSQLGTWSLMKPFFLCIPSFLIVVISFRHLSKRFKIQGAVQRSRQFSWLGNAYWMQGTLVFFIASSHVSLVPSIPLPVLQGLSAHTPLVGTLSSIVLFSIVYLLYTLLTSMTASAEQTSPAFIKDDLIKQLALSLVEQVRNVLEADSVAIFISPEPGAPAELYAVQGIPFKTLPSLLSP